MHSMPRAWRSRRARRRCISSTGGRTSTFKARRLAPADRPPTGTAAAPAAAPPVDRGYPNLLELSYDLPDVVRWRNFLLGERRVASVPIDSIQRAVAFKNFHIHQNTSLSDVALGGNGKVVAKAGRRTMRFDYLIAATGYRIDLGAQPELAHIHELVARVGRSLYARTGRGKRGPAQITRISAQASSSSRARRLAPISCATSTASISPQR